MGKKAHTYRYVYAILHNGTNCLVFQKNRAACFYGGKALENALSIPENHGAGLPCFPGGELNEGETVFAGATRELKEETGVDLSEKVLFCSEFKTIQGKSRKFYGVFFHISDLAAAHAICATNLGEAERIAAAIAAHSYTDEKIEIGSGLIDNELSPEVGITPFADAKALFEKTGDITGWFAELIDSFFRIP